MGYLSQSVNQTFDSLLELLNFKLNWSVEVFLNFNILQVKLVLHYLSEFLVKVIYPSNGYLTWKFPALQVIANSISQLNPSDVLKLLHSLLTIIDSR